MVTAFHLEMNVMMKKKPKTPFNKRVLENWVVCQEKDFTLKTQ